MYDERLCFHRCVYDMSTGYHWSLVTWFLVLSGGIPVRPVCGSTPQTRQGVPPAGGDRGIPHPFAWHAGGLSYLYIFYFLSLQEMVIISFTDLRQKRRMSCGNLYWNGMTRTRETFHGENW